MATCTSCMPKCSIRPKLVRLFFLAGPIVEAQSEGLAPPLLVFIFKLRLRPLCGGIGQWYKDWYKVVQGAYLFGKKWVAPRYGMKWYCGAGRSDSIKIHGSGGKGGGGGGRFTWG